MKEPKWKYAVVMEDEVMGEFLNHEDAVEWARCLIQSGCEGVRIAEWTNDTDPFYVLRGIVGNYA